MISNKKTQITTLGQALSKLLALLILQAYSNFLLTTYIKC